MNKSVLYGGGCAFFVHILARALFNEIVEAKSFVKMNPFYRARSTVPHIEVSLKAAVVVLAEEFHHFSASNVFLEELSMLFMKKLSAWLLLMLLFVKLLLFRK